MALEVQAATASVLASPTLSAWQSTHARERVDLAHYETHIDNYETDSGTQWCAASVTTAPGGATRAASFYVPEVRPGALLDLPVKADPALTKTCPLGAVSFQAPGRNSVAGLVGPLTSAWGRPDEPNVRERAEGLFIRGSGSWRDVFRWRRGEVSVWVAWTGDGHEMTHPRLVVWISRDRVRGIYVFSEGFDTTTAALKLADLRPPLAAEVAPGTKCAAFGPAISLGRLSRLLDAAKRMEPPRRAAALLVADSFVSCVQASNPKSEALITLGVKLEERCAQNGPDYAGNFRTQAEALDPSGPAGALAVLAGLQSPCTLKGAGHWVDRIIVQGQEAMARFSPETVPPEISSWLRLAIARGHAVKLAFNFPPGEGGVGVTHPLTAAQAQHERQEAIAGFARFVHEQPKAPDAVFAWYEAWRLMAGLPPTQPHFGCSCD